MVMIGALAISIWQHGSRAMSRMGRVRRLARKAMTVAAAFTCSHAAYL